MTDLERIRRRLRELREIRRSLARTLARLTGESARPAETFRALRRDPDRRKFEGRSR